MSWIHSILRRLGTTPATNRNTRRQASRRLALIPLEDRVTPAMITWDGGGGDNNWTTATNWAGDVAPMAGDDLVFADLGTFTAFNDFVTTTFASVTIEGANTTLTGNDIDLSGDITATYTSGSSNVTANVILGGGDAIVASGGTLDIAGSISGSAGLTVSGGGTLQLTGSGANTYTGTTLVTAGALVLDKDDGVTAVTGNLTVGDGDGFELVQLGSDGQIADGATVAVGEGATFDVNGHAETVDALVLQGSTVSIGTGGTLALVSSISTFDAANNTTALIQGGTLDLGGSAGFAITVNDDASTLIDLRISSVIDNGGISKSGNGILALAGANTYAGTTDVTAGAIQAESDGALGTVGSGTTVSSGASVFFNGSNLTVAEAFTISGSGFTSSGALATLDGSATLTGTVDLAANSQIGASIASTLTINGVIDDGGSAYDLTILQAASGRTILGGVNLFDGNVIMNGGFLRVTNSDALGDSATASMVTVPTGSTLELSGGISLPATKSLTLSGTPVSGEGKISNVAGVNVIAGNVTFSSDQTFAAASGTTLTFDGMVDQGGSFVIFKTGDGTVVMNGNNTFVGAFVSAGTLLLNGSNPVGINGVVVSGTGILGGSGTLGDVALTGGTLAPGNSPGILSTGILFADSSSTLSVELNGTTVGTQYDQVSVTGAVSLGGTLSVSLGYTPALGDSFTIIDNDLADAVTGTFTGLAEGATFTAGGFTFQITYAGGTGNDVVLTVIETPTVSVMGSPNPSVFGESVTYSVTVTGSGATPTGNVTLVIDGAMVETVALVGGAATFTGVTSLSVGTHIVSVTYAGAGFYASSSGTLSGGQVVNQASTSVSVMSSNPTSVFGEAVTLTATVAPVAPGAGTPTGTVDFFDGATLLGSATLVGGVASLTTSTLSVGSSSITAVFSGDTSFTGSTSAPVTQTVNQASTSVSVMSSNPTSVFGESVTLTATVAPVAPGAGTATGTVDFFDGATLLGTATLTAGTATLTTSALSVTAHSITAVFSGDTSFTGSTSAPVTQTVNQAATTTVASSSNLSAVFGETITLTATVAPVAPGAGTATGTVSFFDGATLLGTAAVSGGMATLTTSALSIAPHPIIAIFNGDMNFASSASPVVIQIVTQAATTTVVTSSNLSATEGESVTFTATVSATAPGSGTATGTVDFFDGATLLGTATLSGGVATFSTSVLSIATHTITAVFGGDVNFTGSVSAPISQVVSQNGTTTVVTSSDLTTAFGESVTFTATVTVSGMGMGTPTGSVEFFDGTTSLGMADLTGGVATLTVSALSVGSHAITAVFTGTGGFGASTSPVETQVVELASTTVGLVSSAAASVSGDPVTFTATVAPVAPGAGTPSGMVEFFDGAVSLGTVALTSGVATLTVSALSVGSHGITAVFSGDAGFATSTSSAVEQSVAPTATTLVLTSSDASSDFRQSVTFTATVSAPSQPAGTVTFFVDGVAVATVALDGSGSASFSSSDLATGNRSVTATFNPATSDFAASSATLAQTVLAPVGNDVDGDGQADIIVGPSSGSSNIKILNADGTEVRSFFAYDGFQGGVVSAGGDANGDGRTDVITGTSSASSHVKVFDGASGNELYSFFAFDGFNGGVDVASGDLDGDGLADLIVGSKGASSHVKVFSGADGSEMRSFFAFDGFNGGVNVSSADVDGDGIADIIVSTASNSSHVKVFSGADGALIRSFFAFDGFQGGVTLSAGDINGDGFADLVVAPSRGSSHVKVFSGADGSELQSFFALPGFTGNLSVAVADVNGDGGLDILTGASTGSSDVQAFDGRTLEPLDALLAFEGFLGGVQVG